MNLKNTSFVAALVATMLACSSPQKEKSEMKENIGPEVLIGTYTGDGSQGIYRAYLDMKEEILTKPELVAQADNPSFLAISQNRQMVYAANEAGEGVVSAFRWNEARTALELTSRQPSQGAAPCHVSISPEGGLVSIANYVGGNVMSFSLAEEGKQLSTPVLRQHEGSGPNADRQEAPHAHCTIFSKDGKWLYAIDLGIDQIVKYPVGELSIGEGQTAFNTDPGDGPRHMVFHPSQDVAFLVNELSSTVFALSVNTETGDMTAISKLSTLPPRFKGHNQCADIQVSNDGRYVYASNRGHNSIAVFAVSESGELTFITTESVHGDWPRNFALSPDIDNQFLIVANQKSNNIVVFERDLETGLPSYTGNEIELSRPVCLMF